MRIISLKAVYICPKCSGKLERSLENCSGTSEIGKLLEMMLLDPMKCATCKTDAVLNISRLTAQKPLVWRAAMLSLKCENPTCGIYFKTRLVIPMEQVLKLLKVEGAEGFDVTCPKCDGEELKRVGMFVGNPNEYL